MTISDWYQNLLTAMQQGKLAEWAKILPAQIEEGLSSQRYGDLPAWLAAYQTMPVIKPSHVDLENSVTIGSTNDGDAEQLAELRSSLEALIPWRKGPFHIHGVDIDTEWRSDWKWHRVLPHIQPLAGRQVLDVGCGNGYHCLRAYGAGAARVIGVDPSPRFVVQFAMIKRLLGEIPVDVVPVTLEQLPESLAAFDTTFSMGVLYHRRSPMDHLKALKETLRPGGQLVLETLVVDGPEGYSLVPKQRYAMMNNVWFLPSCPTLASWLAKLGFSNIHLVDVNETSLEEQRQTHWMRFHSLSQFLDPNDSTKTIEGYPRPKRAVFIAEA
ncbi:tRNA 5-methoxyuridine(34)/uridine 5-oxyacetic acid(34) synthase CmoB [Halioxenophilus sp. WMMB6]|uniref:tRNA 5-methoxyuridine(34)/uridine 5-oxyacetic acid(34) synthase CmoB n=1 Tax=Halioxenophilus sp. WMMB6 TaxID=3073815 RepID=UPI00295E215D|nr:tRNA 5-methoxyuridine(34)/uridine 5-oxyacetic acid(34) synthase CmoB [Halioxenophilus sp. WMMB6]